MDCLDEIPIEDFALGAGARLLGRDMAAALKLSESLRSTVIDIIDKRLSGQIGLLHNLSDNVDDHENLDKELINRIKKGIEERI